MRKVSFIFLVMIVGMPLVVGADSVLVESQPARNGEWSLLFPRTFFAQTFTVDTPGTLSYVDVLLYRGSLGTDADLMLSVMRLENGLLPQHFPPGDVNVLVPSDSVSLAWHYERFDLTPFAFSVEPGYLYAFVIYGDPAVPEQIGKEYGIGFASGSTDYYTDGQLFVRHNLDEAWNNIPGSQNFYDLTFAVGFVPVPEPIAIDIKPSDDANVINLRGMKKIRVAILSSTDFSAPLEVDQATLTFGFKGDEASFVSCARKPKDVNGDGLMDLVCQFSTNVADFQCGDIEGILMGMKVNGTPIEGKDSVNIAPCK